MRAYADDIVYHITNKRKWEIITESLETYSAASGAQINNNKSFMIPIGSWKSTEKINNLPTTNKGKILGMIICNSFKEMIETNWAQTTAKIRRTMYKQIYRDLNIFERTWHVNTFCLAKLWYLAHILPIPKKIYYDNGKSQ